MKVLNIAILLFFSILSFGQNFTHEVREDGKLIKKTVIKGEFTYFTSYHQNGKIKETGCFLNELRHGEWKQYDEKGNEISVAYFENGNKDGEWQIYAPDQNVTYIISYEDGKKTNVRTEEK